MVSISNRTGSAVKRIMKFTVYLTSDNPRKLKLSIVTDVLNRRKFKLIRLKPYNKYNILPSNDQEMKQWRKFIDNNLKGNRKFFSN
ncbi:Hypothetical predicted protein [Octopus vulgaris]|uniref:Uncharacterized protein n=1 Tax=Octopus vulgaris TaxID=6645 RepID=A0AA36AIR7_OCTVU|nr:Hypothetical predicted protein [Octopus vulgaris]